MSRDKFLAKVPGIYSGIEGEDYHSLDACSNSRLTDLLDSPEMCKHRMSHPLQPTDAMDFGSGTHAWVLEPHSLEKYFIVSTQCCATKKSGDRCQNQGQHRLDGEWFCNIKAHKPEYPDEIRQTLIKQPDWDDMQRIRDKILLHPKAGPMIESAGENELSILQVHEPTGLLCKLRPDISRMPVQTFADLKTCVSARKDAFEANIFRRGYHRQAGVYTHLARQAGLDVQNFVFIAVEKKAPFCVATYRLKNDALAEGWREAEQLLATYRECQQSGIWPGYSDTISDISLPAWAWYHLPFSAEPDWTSADEMFAI